MASARAGTLFEAAAWPQGWDFGVLVGLGQVYPTPGLKSGPAPLRSHRMEQHARNRRDVANRFTLVNAGVGIPVRFAISGINCPAPGPTRPAWPRSSAPWRRSGKAPLADQLGGVLTNWISQVGEVAGPPILCSMRRIWAASHPTSTRRATAACITVPSSLRSSTTIISALPLVIKAFDPIDPPDVGALVVTGASRTRSEPASRLGQDHRPGFAGRKARTRGPS